MATNNFKPFATGAGANVTSQADWEALIALATGFTSGLARSDQVNKALRQGTTMSSVLAQFIADMTGTDVLDNGDTATLLAQLKNALTGRLLNVQTFTSSGTYTPTANTKYIIVEAVGGGGGGGGCPATSTGQISTGNGGTAGSYAKVLIRTGFAGGVSVTVGSAGLGIVGNSAGAGGDTSFGGFFTCRGGGGGGGRGPIAPPVGVGGAGAVGGGVVLNTGQMIEFFVGAPGTPGYSSSLAVIIPGLGGQSHFGGPNTAGAAGSQPGAAPNYGAGGTAGLIGQNAAAIAGGNGGAGVVIVWEFE